jgi:hypothetical protein
MTIAGIAIGEAVLIAALLYVRTASPPSAPASKDIPIVIYSPLADGDILVDGRITGVTPQALRVGSDVSAIGVRTHESAGAAAAAPAPRTAREPRRSGGITLRSPIELEVFEGERLLGHAEEPIIISAGRHELDLVNRALGYRARRVVDIAEGQVVSLSMVPANGLVSANASPWAEVWIDGHSVGETPLANLEVPIGEHEIVFRHPQLGEQRKNAVVRTDTLTLVSVDFRE